MGSVALHASRCDRSHSVPRSGLTAGSSSDPASRAAGCPPRTPGSRAASSRLRPTQLRLLAGLRVGMQGRILLLNIYCSSRSCKRLALHAGGLSLHACHHSLVCASEKATFRTRSQRSTKPARHLQPLPAHVPLLSLGIGIRACGSVQNAQARLGMRLVACKGLCLITTATAGCAEGPAQRLGSLRPGNANRAVDATLSPSGGPVSSPTMGLLSGMPDPHASSRLTLVRVLVAVVFPSNSDCGRLSFRTETSGRGLVN